KSAAVIALWSPKANQSDFVKFQATLAHAAGKLVNARVNGDALPTHLGEITAIDLTAWDGAALNDDIADLMRRLRAILPKPAPVTPAKKPKTPFTLPAPVRAGIAAVIVVAALGLVGYGAGRAMNGGIDFAAMLPKARVAQPAEAATPVSAPMG